jgi:hypothetical protein
MDFIKKDKMEGFDGFMKREIYTIPLVMPMQMG